MKDADQRYVNTHAGEVLLLSFAKVFSSRPAIVIIHMRWQE